MKMKKIICITMVVCLMFLGCNRESSNDTELMEGEVLIIPSSLYDESTKKLGAHLDMTTGCVEIEYKGNKKCIGVKYETWEGGILKNSTNIFKISIDDGFNGEVSISLKDIVMDNLETSQTTIMTTVISDQNGYSRSRKYIDRYPKSYGSSPCNIIEAFKDTDDNEISIWGFMATDDGTSSVYSQEKSIEATAEKVDWALILKVYFEDKIE
ncbi:hypothetical protein [Oceanirhabdus seepicola]|uniref:Lipoprotein n=1 Tax=Oceanirhabdus seepicola TaxID=2828781 RepID=A0A9J6P3S8_9CLOT|nr:hypothetical protein [Oceanirhabdus seepicola]MCM1990988.1 hypothetical protein [Oceanirhabdus seepicola]